MTNKQRLMKLMREKAGETLSSAPNRAVEGVRRCWREIDDVIERVTGRWADKLEEKED